MVVSPSVARLILQREREGRYVLLLVARFETRQHGSDLFQGQTKGQRSLAISRVLGVNPLHISDLFYRSVFFTRLIRSGKDREQRLAASKCFVGPPRLLVPCFYRSSAHCCRLLLLLAARTFRSKTDLCFRHLLLLPDAPCDSSVFRSSEPRSEFLAAVSPFAGRKNR